MSVIFEALIISFLLNMIMFSIAYWLQTDKLTDITYSLSFILIGIYVYSQNTGSTLAEILLLLMIILWAVRLGGYLFLRINSMGIDHRFDEMRPVWHRFIKFWLLQAVSVWIISLPFIFGLESSGMHSSLEPLHWLGLLFWIIGFLLESIADFQKYRFRNNPENDGQFMNRGLFAFIQYPNYLGEMLLWIGVFVYCIPSLDGLKWISIISPLWIIILLLFISGIPYLDRQTEKRYGHLDSFKRYKERTARLIPGIY